MLRARYAIIHAIHFCIRGMLLCGLCCSSPVLLADDAAVLDLLRGYEWQLQEDKLRSVGADAYRSLLDIASDTSQVNFIRARAALALTIFPNDEVWTFYEREISTGQNPLRRRQLVQNFCTSFLPSRPVKVESALMPLLKASDARLRSNAARCLQQLGSDRSSKALASYRETISDAWEVRAAGFEE